MLYMSVDFYFYRLLGSFVGRSVSQYGDGDGDDDDDDGERAAIRETYRLATFPPTVTLCTKQQQQAAAAAVLVE